MSASHIHDGLCLLMKTASPMIHGTSHNNRLEPWQQNLWTVCLKVQYVASDSLSEVTQKK